MGSWRRGRGGLIGSPAPGGSGRAPPSQGSRCRFSSPALPSRVPGQGMSCSRRSLPGARGQGGPGGVLPSSPPHLLPAQVRAPPPPLPPLTHAAPGLARCWVWDRVRGWGGAWRRTGRPAPSGGCALRGRAPLAATAREPPSPPPPPQRLSRAPLPRPGRRTARPPPGKVGCGPVGKESSPQTLACQGSLLGWGE